MIKFLNNSQEEINEVVELTAQKRQLNTVIVEKDNHKLVISKWTKQQSKNF